MQRVVRQPRLAVDLDRERVLRVEELRVLAVRPRRARHGDEHALEVAVEGERHVGHHLRFDDAAGVGPVGLQERAPPTTVTDSSIAPTSIFRSTRIVVLTGTLMPSRTTA